MSLLAILESLLIGPLKLVFEIIFDIANRVIGHPGLAIIVLSLIMNILVLPLYKRADAMQEEARDIDNKLRDGVAHIKKTFSGDERMMILQTYYRQNNYKPTSALNGSVSLLLEIPFFMAAYQFLSHLEVLNGVSLGPIADLGAPDGLIVIGGLAINLLPVLMTLINVISSAIYLKGFPLKTKIQLYAMALFFLVFLYESPACLVFYWTLNNVFSLVKNIFYKLKNPQKILRIVTSIAGISLLGFGILGYETDSIRRKILVMGLGVLLQLPVLMPLVKSKIKITNRNSKSNKKLFVLGTLFLTVLVGLLIPSTFIAASPHDYVDISYFHNPLWYVVSATCLAAGTFMVWMRVFYWLANEKGKAIFDKLVWVLCGVMLVNYMFFGTELGMLTPNLQYEKGLIFTAKEQLINMAVVAIISVSMYFAAIKWKKLTATILATAVIALGGMSILNISTINKSVSELSTQNAKFGENMASFRLSKNGNNVVVIMLDRAMNEYVPYIFNEKPELKEQFDGFTYYSNTISFGGYTNYGSPGLFGGYEYTPVEMNKRNTESMVSKQNEALKMMPVLFSQNEYEVTVCDPVYANYKKIPDLSVFEEYPEINTFITKGAFSGKEQKQVAIENNKRNFFCFSLMKTMPLISQETIYDGGRYNQASYISDGDIYSTQIVKNISKASGISELFMEPYNVLQNLSYITEITEDQTNTFMYMVNDTTHEPMLLQEGEYLPAQEVDNSVYDTENAERFIVNGQTLKVDNTQQMIHYHANMAAYLVLGEWFQFLKENGVYDNTRIILVADHGQDLAHLEELMIESGETKIDLEMYYPMLMVKDFNSTGFTTSEEFMTNADVPTLAVSDIIENPINPFTGKEINNKEKAAHEQFIILSEEWDVRKHEGNTFYASKWASVKNDMRDKNNWTFYENEMILDEHIVE